MFNVFREKVYSLGISNKFLVISVLIIILVIFLHFYNDANVEEKFINYITKMGYYNRDGGNFYYLNVKDTTLNEYFSNVDNNVNSSYEVNYFDVDSLLFKKNIRDYVDGVDFSLNETYDFVSKAVSYNYRVEEIGEATFIFSGKYLFKDGEFVFTCEKDYSYQFNVFDDDSLICNKLESDVRDFYMESLDIVGNYSLINRMIKKK